jgi:hypothetical protein
MSSYTQLKFLTFLLLAACCLPARAQTQLIQSNTDVVYQSYSSVVPILTVSTSTGMVGVNTRNPTQALEVHGKVLIRDADQAININSIHPYNLWVTDGVVGEDLFIVDRENWADHVFAANYSLMNLTDLKKFIQQHKHLPNIPSQTEVQQEGYSQHDINAGLLEKIEELVLYTIQQEEALKNQERIIAEQNKQIEELKILTGKLLNRFPKNK